MSDIGGRDWFRGRGGIYQPRGRIVPGRKELPRDPRLFPGEDGPLNGAPDPGNPIEGFYDCYGGENNLFTPGGTYAVIADQSGRGRNLSGNPDTAASALIYPYRDGLQSLPQPNGVTHHAQSSQPPERILSPSLYQVCAWNPITPNSGWMGYGWSTVTGLLAGFRYNRNASANYNSLRPRWNSSAGSMGLLTVDGPELPSGDMGVNSWVAAGWSHTVNGDETQSTNLFSVYYDDGSGIVTKAGDRAFFENASLTGNTPGDTNVARDNFDGFSTQFSRGSVGTGVYYGFGLEIEDHQNAMVALGYVISDSAGAQIAALLNT